MPRPARGRLTPWIESLILGYGSEEEVGSSGRLKAHVIGVSQMSQSQARSSDGPPGVLYLSDGVLQIPAILTASAWEHLQEQEDRESFNSLLNTTVCIQDFRLQFHMASEQTKCRFFLSVGELATTAAGPVKDNTPCSTTQPSIRLKICKTWRALLGQETQDSQKSQGEFELSELLGEWRHDCLQAVLEDVKERLSSRPVSPQASTSTHNPSLTLQDASTSWDVDRVKYKGEECFSVPLKCLLIPEEDDQQLQTPPDVGGVSSEDTKRDSPQVKTTPPSVDAAAAERDRDTSESSVEDMIPAGIDGDIRPLSNPWDIFSPPSSSDESPEATPGPSLQNPPAAELKSDHSTVLTSTQIPVHSLTGSRQTSEKSYLTPYQNPPLSAGLAATAGSATSVSPPEPFATPSNLSPATDKAQNHPAVEQESQILESDTEETLVRKCRKAKRKRSEPTAEALTAVVEVEEEIGGSPPSWLFDSPTGAEEGGGGGQGQAAWTASSKKSPTVHSDGRKFSYSYQASGQNLLDFSRFSVAESLVHWAAKYLVVPKQTENPRDTSVTSEQSHRTGQR